MWTNMTEHATHAFVVALRRARFVPPDGLPLPFVGFVALFVFSGNSARRAACTLANVSPAYRSATITSKKWTESSRFGSDRLQDRDQVPYCWSSQTCQSWLFVRSQNAIASDGSKSAIAIVDSGTGTRRAISVRAGPCGTGRWTRR
jgi:hypothetical protein